MNDKLDKILDLLRSQNEMIKDIHDYVKEVTSEKYIGESRMTSFSINLAADILTEADREWAKRYGKVCCSIWQVCDHYINPNRKYDREQKTYTRRPSNKACPNYEYGDDNFENRKRCLKKKNTR